MFSRPITAAKIDRRTFGKLATAGLALSHLPTNALAHAAESKWRYIVASCMYGTMPLEEILPQVPRAGARHIDIWPKVHGNQREQIEQMGHEKFKQLLDEHGVEVGIFTRYDLGPQKIAEELPVAGDYGARIVVTGSGGPKGLSGAEQKDALGALVKRLEPQCKQAEACGVRIAIENHGNALLESPDSIRWFADFAKGRPLGVAMAPYHLPQEPDLLASLIRDLGDRLFHFYAWEHGMGCFDKLPKDQELMQMPGRGPLDFGPMMAAMANIDYDGFVQVFMHPVPRGIPILETADLVTAEINRSRAYLDGLRA